MWLLAIWYIVKCICFCLFPTLKLKENPCWFNFWHFNYDVPWCGPLWVNFIWDSLFFINLMSVSFTRLGKFLTIVFLNWFAVPASFSSLSGNRVIWMLICLMSSQRFLNLSSFLKFFVLFTVLIGCFLLSCLSNSCFDSLLHLFCPWFHLMYSSFQLLYS